MCGPQSYSKTATFIFIFLFDQFFNISWLTKIWGQANNSVDIETTNNPLHSARYMLKYITKDKDSEIQGNRYFISKSLRKYMEPVVGINLTAIPTDIDPNHELIRNVRHFLKDAKEEIEHSGGIMMDFGFCIPPPSPPSTSKCKQTGQLIHSRGVSPLLAKSLFTSLYEMTEPLPF